MFKRFSNFISVLSIKYIDSGIMSPQVFAFHRHVSLRFREFVHPFSMSPNSLYKKSLLMMMLSSL